MEAPAVSAIQCWCGCPPERHTVRVGEETTGCVNHINCSAFLLLDRKKSVPKTSPTPLVEWWADTATQELDSVTKKMAEYGGRGGSLDLIHIGHVLARSLDMNVSDEFAIEIGIAFYVQGKVSRWLAALTNGRTASEDTLHDISVYTKMAQRNRATGGRID